MNFFLPIGLVLTSLLILSCDKSNPDFENGITTEYEARNTGRLTIKDGCITLTYPKEQYPASTLPDGYKIIPIFGSSPKIVENGNAIEVNGIVFRDGDFVEMSGRGFDKSNLKVSNSNEDCAADEYWEVGGTGLKHINEMKLNER